MSVGCGVGLGELFWPLPSLLSLLGTLLISPWKGEGDGVRERGWSVAGGGFVGRGSCSAKGLEVCACYNLDI